MFKFITRGLQFLVLFISIGLLIFFSPPSCIGGSSTEEGNKPPKDPSGLRIKLGSIILNWEDNSNNENGFKIERKIGTSGSFQEIASVGRNITTFTDSNILQEGIPLSYRVSAYNSAGKSAPSNDASIATTLWTGMLDLKVSGNYAYCAFRNGLVIIDISIPSSPHKVSGLFGGLGGSGMGIDLKGSYAYLAYEKKGLLIIDVSNPLSPSLAGVYDTPGEANDVIVDGNYAYIADASDGVYIVDISNPALPTLVSSINTPGYAHAISVQNNYIYVADGSSGLQIIDVSDIHNPIIIGSFDTPGTSDDPTGNSYLGALDLFINGNYAYIANDSSGMIIVDISNPSSPLQVGNQSSGERTRGVYVSGNYAYMADFWWGGLQIVDISNPASPISIASYWSWPMGYCQKVVVLGNYAYLACDDFSLKIVNITTPPLPVLEGFYNESDWTQALFLNGNYLYLASNWTGFNIIDISNPIRPLNIGYTPLPSAALEIFVDSKYAYVADAYDGLQIVDVSNPSFPIIVGSYPSIYGQDVFVKDNLAFVVGSDLQILDISNKSIPFFVSSCSTNGYPFRITINGNYAYIATWSGLRIIDISNPSLPILVGSYDTSQAEGIVVQDNFAYIADHYDGLLIFDVGNPASPTLLSTLSTPGTSQDLFMSDNIAYIADGDAGLLKIDVQDKTSPSIVGSNDTPGIVLGVVVNGNYIYIADYSSILMLTK